MYTSLRDCIIDLAKKNDLININIPVDANLEMAEIHRRIHEAGGPAIHFTNIINNQFEAASNIYGTRERAEYLFRDSIPLLKKLGEIRSDPIKAVKSPFRNIGTLLNARYALPWKKFLTRLKYSSKISDLPFVKSWPKDGGPFVLLPQVLSLPPGTQNLMKSNLGMYRIQLAGNDYIPDKEIGLHYQLHRGIGVHHTQYLESEDDFKVSIFIGGPPAHALAAIFPLPEQLSEISFAGLLNNARFQYSIRNGFIISEQADFVITGTVDKQIKKPEGPFGDHLGYYSLQHDFPVLKIENVYHRQDPIWHFTVVGRPPQEDSFLGHIIHEVVKDLVPKEFPGLKSLHAVDAAGVHPLLLAVGKERYMPFREKRPEEILTMANRILGSGQTSLAKYLIIAAENHDELLDVFDIPTYFQYVFSRIHFDRDLHFITKTTVDTLDYSGDGWNAGSKLILACCSDPIRALTSILNDSFSMDGHLTKPNFIDKGLLCISAPGFESYEMESSKIKNWVHSMADNDLSGIALIVLCDDSEFSSASWNNFLWVTFTRSNPSHDVYGFGSRIEYKHWACQGPLIIDARIKPHHAPLLETDPKVSEKVDHYFRKGGPLYGLNKKSKPTY
ncbi:MAG: UbiD family decarboxylase [Saprospiraceae bacterium]